MRTTSSVAFYCRPCKTTKTGQAPVELSIIINGHRTFINLPRKEDPKEFKKALMSKKDNDTKRYLHEIRTKLNEIQTDMMRNNIPLTATALKEYFRSGGIKPYTLDDLWSDYLALQRRRIGITITDMGYRKYISARNTMYSYVEKDMQVKDITPATIQNILVNIQAIYKPSTVFSIMTKLKSVIIYARDNNKLDKNPFQGIRYSKGQTEIEYLTEDEIKTLMTKEIGIERLERVRDLAVFQLSSGMAYADTQLLTPDDIQENNGAYYINKTRKKTGITYTSVLFPEGVEILRKYDYQLPRITNQKLNAYLKEIQTITGITKTLHTHLFRKTYGTRLLNRGVRLETVSKCLGHSSTQITQQVYAKLLQETIIKEVVSVL